MKIFIYTILLFTCSVSFSQEVNPDQLYAEAVALLEEEAYSEAIEKFKQVEALGLTSSYMHYNQGTAYLKLGDVANSVLYLERAFRSEPSNADIRHNLELARSNIDSEIIEIPDFILVRIWRSIAGLFSPVIWFIIEILLAIGLLFGLYKWKFSKVESTRLKGFVAGLVCLGLLLIAILAGYTSDRMVHHKETGILMVSTDLHMGADERSDAINSLSEGVKVKVIDRIGEWYRVQLINKEEGWLKVNDITLI